MDTIEKIVIEAQGLGTSDIHIVAGLPIRYRIDGKLESRGQEVLSPADCEMLCRQMVGDELDTISKIGELDAARTFAGLRTRLNIFRQQECYSAAIRILSDHIPPMSALGLPPVANEFVKYQRGIVLITGETGSGKSTTLASILNEINLTQQKHIITLENPIEYVYMPKFCTINQREIGVDTRSFTDGLRASLREDPDVILIGEMRDMDTIETALIAAETGHLVFATLHTSSTADTVDRIVSVFPGERQQQVRLQLSMTLKAVISQQLLPRREEAGRILACEVMVVNAAIRNLIREGKTQQIVNAIATSANDGNITKDNALIDMVRHYCISKETALEAGNDAAYLKRMLML